MPKFNSRSIEDRLEDLAAHTRPEDRFNEEGRGNSLETRLELAEARAGITPPAPLDRSGRRSEPEDVVAALNRSIDIERTISRTATQRISTLEAEAARLLAENAATVATFEAQVAELNARLSGYSKDAVVAQLTSECNDLKQRLNIEAHSRNLLEGLCKVRGIDASQAVPMDGGAPAAVESVDVYDRRMREAKTAAERQSVAEDFRRAVKEGRITSAKKGH